MATLKDVAKRAGVGLGTASRAINRTGRVSQETIEKVDRAIDELNYIPNEFARNFKKSTTKLVGVLVPTVAHPFFAELVLHIEEALFEKNYKILLCNSHLSKKKENQYLTMLKQNKVAGIITISYEDYGAQLDVGLPLVAIDRYLSDDIPHVTSNNYEGGLIATKELIRSGAKNLAYFGGKPAFESSVSDRKKAFIDIVKEENIPYVVHEINHIDDKELEYAREFVKLYPSADGIFTNSDYYAAAVVKAYEEIDKKVPEDVQVIGFDGIQKNKLFSPYLTTIIQDVRGMAYKSVELIMDIIEEREVESENIINVTYRKGDTTR